MWKHHFIRNLQEKCRYQQKSGTSDKKESGTSDAKKSGTSERLTAYARLQLPHLLPQGTTLLADEVSYCTWPELGIVGCQRVDRCLVTAKVRSSSCTAKVNRTSWHGRWSLEVGKYRILLQLHSFLIFLTVGRTRKTDLFQRFIDRNPLWVCRACDFASTIAAALPSNAQSLFCIWAFNAVSSTSSLLSTFLLRFSVHPIQALKV